MNFCCNIPSENQTVVKLLKGLKITIAFCKLNRNVVWVGKVLCWAMTMGQTLLLYSDHITFKIKKNLKSQDKQNRCVQRTNIH